MEIYVKCPKVGNLMKVPLDDWVTNYSELRVYLSELFGIASADFYLMEDMKCLNIGNTPLQNCSIGAVYSITMKIKGGKGGFGSLLKGQPAVKKRTKNFDSCRDLTGRRIRHVNQEKQMQDYLNKKKEEELLIKSYLEGDNNMQLPKSNQLELSSKSHNFHIQDIQISKSVVNAITYLANKRKNHVPENTQANEKHAITEKIEKSKLLDDTACIEDLESRLFDDI